MRWLSNLGLGLGQNGERSNELAACAQPQLMTHTHEENKPKQQPKKKQKKKEKK